MKAETSNYFVMKSAAFDGTVGFRFNQDGRLVGLEVEADLSVMQHDFLFQHLPTTVEQMREFRKWLLSIKSGASIEEVALQVSFEDFWDRYFYGRKSDNSSKQTARKRWERMPKTEQALAYGYVRKYMNNIASGCGVKLAETYLGSGVWNN